MMGYQKPYKIFILVLLTGLVFYSEAGAGRTISKSHGDRAVFCADGLAGGTTAHRFNANGINNLNIEIEDILEKEKFVEKALEKDLDVLKKQIEKHDFNAREIETLTQHVYSLEIEFYQNLMTCFDKIRGRQAGISREFIGRGPVFEQTPLIGAH